MQRWKSPSQFKTKKRIFVPDYIVVNDSIVTEKCLPEVTQKIRENRHQMMQRLGEERRRNATGYYAKENTSYNKITILTSTTWWKADVNRGLKLKFLFFNSLRSGRFKKFNKASPTLSSYEWVDCHHQTGLPRKFANAFLWSHVFAQPKAISLHNNWVLMFRLDSEMTYRLIEYFFFLFAGNLIFSVRHIKRYCCSCPMRGKKARLGTLSLSSRNSICIQ